MFWFDYTYLKIYAVIIIVENGYKLTFFNQILLTFTITPVIRNVLENTGRSATPALTHLKNEDAPRLIVNVTGLFWLLRESGI